MKKTIDISRKIDIMRTMKNINNTNIVDIFKALSNETRLNILQWLKDPEHCFPPQGTHMPEGESFANCACVGSICDKAGVSQSTISNYLDMLQRVDLLESRRYGKWTYYRRNEETIQQLARFIGREL